MEIEHLHSPISEPKPWTMHGCWTEQKEKLDLCIHVVSVPYRSQTRRLAISIERGMGGRRSVHQRWDRSCMTTSFCPPALAPPVPLTTSPLTATTPTLPDHLRRIWRVAMAQRAGGFWSGTRASRLGLVVFWHEEHEEGMLVLLAAGSNARRGRIQRIQVNFDQSQSGRASKCVPTWGIPGRCSHPPPHRRLRATWRDPTNPRRVRHWMLPLFRGHGEGEGRRNG